MISEKIAFQDLQLRKVRHAKDGTNLQLNHSHIVTKISFVNVLLECLPTQVWKRFAKDQEPLLRKVIYAMGTIISLVAHSQNVTKVSSVSLVTFTQSQVQKTFARNLQE